MSDFTAFDSWARSDEGRRALGNGQFSDEPSREQALRMAFDVGFHSGVAIGETRSIPVGEVYPRRHGIPPQYESDWPLEDTDIEWQKKGRFHLNNIIRNYNSWQVNGYRGGEEVWALLAQLELFMETTGQVDGGSGWLIVANRMYDYVNKVKVND